MKLNELAAQQREQEQVKLLLADLENRLAPERYQAIVGMIEKCERKSAV